MYAMRKLASGIVLLSFVLLSVALKA